MEVRRRLRGFHHISAALQHPETGMFEANQRLNPHRYAYAL